ncbi:DUF4391 domain-containing protein [Desulfopila sp. IMCC35008]|uniref:DUF4391 domain-containing protein n=1 Tax=Desulfopila sp. IMCC35008 TaxID=2653858 RepID=UPI0013D03EA2|nr:DUF4391 domain-containing protein [Desulfopila sp. IMCC35008]
MSSSVILHPYAFPKAAAFGRMVAKGKIYEYATPTKKVKELFVAQVEKITWSYKLSPATINLPASAGVEEIQIFSVRLKNGDLSHEVLQTVDKAIPSPILFELLFKGRTRYVGAYKRPNEADKNKWVVSSYFQSTWMDNETERVNLPVVLSMGALYQAFLTAISPLRFREGETLDNLVARIDLLRVKEREAEKLENRMKKEKQFNRRVEMNRALNELNIEINTLKE